jgi:hypothetical protein
LVVTLSNSANGPPIADYHHCARRYSAWCANPHAESVRDPIGWGDERRQRILGVDPLHECCFALWLREITQTHQGRTQGTVGAMM